MTCKKRYDNNSEYLDMNCKLGFWMSNELRPTEGVSSILILLTFQVFLKKMQNQRFLLRRSNSEKVVAQELMKRTQKDTKC
ncbi:hypothetical protein P8452_72526 [Trifolium repens]|nr:hypothetical protein P8452_72526 [Trifolium repens]